MPSLYTHKASTKKKEKTSRQRCLENIGHNDFSFKIFISDCVFGFYNEGRPYFECITEEVFRWNLAVKCYKTPQKSTFLQFFVNIFLTMLIYVCKDFKQTQAKLVAAPQTALFKTSFTIFLKPLKYLICAPIFPPLSET